MKTIIAKAHIEQGRMRIEIPVSDDLPEGDLDVIIQVEEHRRPLQQLVLPEAWHWNNWPAESRFGREDVYDDDGC